MTAQATPANVHSYWAVIRPDFLKPGNFTVSKRDEAREWCTANCKDKFISSDICPWAFLSKDDAGQFQGRYGGTLAFKDAT